MEMNNRLVEGIKRKSEAAFKEVYEQYFKLVKHVIFKMVKKHEVANELVQETFMKVYEKIDTYQVDTNLKFWILQIAKNTAYDYLRKESRRPDIIVNEEMIDYTESTIEEKNYDGLFEQIKHIVSEDEYEIVILRVFHNLKFHEIATILDVTTAVTTNKYARAIKKLKKELKEEDLHE